MATKPPHPPHPPQLWLLSLSEQVRRVKRGEVKAVDLVESHYGRLLEIEALNAVVTLVPKAEALAAAQNIDPSLPLAGIVMTIKDSLWTKGVRTTAGSLGLKDHIPTYDATVVERLKCAGAILIGKTNTPELTLAFETDNLVFGRTNNPYDVQRTPGGSSGGAAAVVAVGGAPFDLGTDYGGSIRVPSSWCGCAGLKPTHGAVSRHGHILDYTCGLTESFQTIGPIARTVDDLALLFPLISGPDGKDPYVHPPRPFQQVETSKLRIGVFSDVLEDGPVLSADSRRVLSAASMSLEPHVKTIMQVPKLPFLGETHRIWRSLALADNGLVYQKKLQEIGTSKPSLEWIFPDVDQTKSAAEINDLLTDLARYRSSVLDLFKNYDVLLTPVSTDGPAPRHGGSRSNLNTLTFTYAFNLSGHPVVVVRAGSSDQLPIGVQVVASHWREDIALAVAKLIEANCPDAGWRLPPNFDVS